MTRAIVAVPLDDGAETEIHFVGMWEPADRVVAFASVREALLAHEVAHNSDPECELRHDLTPHPVKVVGDRGAPFSALVHAPTGLVEEALQRLDALSWRATTVGTW